MSIIRCIDQCVSSSAPSYPSQPTGFSDFTGPGTPGVGGDFSSPGPPPLSYQSELSSALLTPDKPPPHPLAGQVTQQHLHHLHHHHVLTVNIKPPLFPSLLPPPLLFLSLSFSSLPLRLPLPLSLFPLLFLSVSSSSSLSDVGLRTSGLHFPWCSSLPAAVTGSPR